jgi:hypothetical protein
MSVCINDITLVPEHADAIRSVSVPYHPRMMRMMSLRTIVQWVGYGRVRSIEVGRKIREVVLLPGVEPLGHI